MADDSAPVSDSNTSDSERRRLCYVKAPWVWFTTQPLDKQWGDDWNDAPYQHNAGRPYPPDNGRIEKVAYDGPLFAPGQPPRTEYDGIGERVHDGVAVEDMNRGDDRIPWLVETNYGEMYGMAGIKIEAGVSLQEFVGLVQEVGGSVYRALDSDNEQEVGDA